MAQVSFAVILTHDAPRARRCLEAIAAQELESEILLVLNDADADMRALALGFPGVRVLHDGADLGAVLGWNLALRAAHAPYVCVVHEDSAPEPGCVARLLATLAERPDAGAVGPVNLTPGESPPRGCGAILWADATTSLLPEPVVADAPYAVDYASSACLMLDRAAALGAGGFDLRSAPAIYVDVNIACALWSTGRSVLCEPRITNLHDRGAMLNPAHGERRGQRFRRFLWARNRERFQAGWAELLAGQAPPGDLDAALGRIRDREAAVRAAAAPAPPDRLELPADLEAVAAAHRRELEDAFLAHLVEREAALQAEVEWLHGHVAEQAAELERVHREYAALWKDRERLLQSTGRP